jgi:hypothetical protein
VSGWGVRPGDWQIGASVQQQLLPRVSAEFGYTRRWLTNFTWDNNVLQATNQFDTFSVTAANDSRLPEEARGRTISGLYNVQQSVASQVNNITKLASDAGGDYSQVYNGFLLNVSARTRNGLTFQGGFDTGTTTTTTAACGGLTGVHRLGAQGPTNPWCAPSTGGLRATPASAPTRCPRSTCSSRARSAATRVRRWPRTWCTRGQTTLGRAFANNAPNVTVNLVEPARCMAIA